MDSCQIFLFGDLTISFEEDLRQLLHVVGNGILSSFLDQVGFVLREEIGRLSAEQQDLLPRFTTLVDLLHNLKECRGAPALRSALLCLYQIGQFLRYVPQNSPKLTLAYLNSLNSDIMGKARGPSRMRKTAIWWVYARAHSLPLQLVPLILFPRWYLLASKQFS